MLKRRPTREVNVLDAFDNASKPKEQGHLFRLYIAGNSPRSIRAVKRIKEICERELPGHYTLEIIDLYQQPARAIADEIVAAPTLVRRMPQPIRLVGDFSDEQKVMTLFNYRNSGMPK